jgi:predicted membrane protein
VVFSSVDERVRSVVPAHLEFGSRFGSIEMDFTEAVFANAVTEIVVDVVFGNVELTFPADIAIESDVHGIFSSAEMKEPVVRSASSGRTVRISGRALFGSVEIRVAGGGQEA